MLDADGVAAVDVILEPFKVGQDRVVVDASDFEEGPTNTASVLRGDAFLSPWMVKYARCACTRASHFAKRFVAMMLTADRPALA